ncbi:MAG: class I SAM-dependent methyltransferase [Promethearchaeota archaeon]
MPLIIIILLLMFLICIVSTEGRYFGKRLLRRIYDLRTGEFEIRDDWELWNHLVRRIHVSSSEKLLDLGTQTGHLPRLVARQRGFQGIAVGVDWSAEMIQEAKRQARLEGTSQHTRFIHADIQQPLPFSDDTFTLLVCVTGVLDAFRYPDALFKEIRRVLQPSGRVIFSISRHQLKTSGIRDLKWFSGQLAKHGFAKPKLFPWTAAQQLIESQLEK